MFKQFAAAALAISISTGALAQDKDNAAFFAKTQEAQITYIETSLSMPRALVSKTQGACVRQWAASHQADGYIGIVTAIKKFSDYHPSLVIAAAMEKVCGKFDLANN